MVKLLKAEIDFSGKFAIFLKHATWCCHLRLHHITSQIIFEADFNKILWDFSAVSAICRDWPGGQVLPWPS